MLVAGTFLREGKTRFVAWVKIEGHRRKCYVPMSTKLSRYLDPVGKKVRLELRGERYWVEQIKLQGKWVWVDAAMATELLKRSLERQGKVVETEKTVKDYRFDLWCEGVGYEVKSVLSEDKVVSYPNAESARRDKQLRRLQKLVKHGVKVAWVFIVLSRSALRVSLDTEFGQVLYHNVKHGLRVYTYGCVNDRLKEKPLEFVTHALSKGEAK